VDSEKWDSCEPIINIIVLFLLFSIFSCDDEEIKYEVEYAIFSYNGLNIEEYKNSGSYYCDAPRIIRLESSGNWDGNVIFEQWGEKLINRKCDWNDGCFIIDLEDNLCEGVQTVIFQWLFIDADSLKGYFYLTGQSIAAGTEFVAAKIK